MKLILYFICDSDSTQFEEDTTHPRICPICGHIFKGNGWDGIDAHYKSKHEKETGEPYSKWWARMCYEHKAKR